MQVAHLATALGSEPTSVGLAQNTQGVNFQCGTCEYFDKGVCKNSHPKLKDRNVQREWCCNLYDHDGMKVIVA